jgi:hypothetical protein
VLTLAAVLLAVGAVLYTLAVREQDEPAPERLSPARHLEERKAAVYDSLRDLHFEYRLGKLSDEDYRQTKQDLQRELAALNAQIEGLAAKPAPAEPLAQPKSTAQCPHCGARFPQPMKFCGECGKPLSPEGA